MHVESCQDRRSKIGICQLVSDNLELEDFSLVWGFRIRKRTRQTANTNNTTAIPATVHPITRVKYSKMTQKEIICN